MKLTKEQRDFLDAVCGGKYNWELTYEGKVNVKGAVLMSSSGFISMGSLGLTEIPVKFGMVYGNFNCSYNKLTTLKNCPDWVDGDFTFSYNNISTLEDFPNYIRFNVYMQKNNLTEYFKNIREEDFKFWGKIRYWGEILKEYPFLINIAKNYMESITLRLYLNEIPQTKLYLK
jgi:hypothetical protein